MRLSSNGFAVECTCFITDGNEILYASVLDKYKGKLKALLQSISCGKSIYLTRDYDTDKDIDYFRTVQIGSDNKRDMENWVTMNYSNRERFYYGEIYNKKLHQKVPEFLITTNEYFAEDLYNFLLNSFDLGLPLKEQDEEIYNLWKNYFVKTLTEIGVVYEKYSYRTQNIYCSPNHELPFHGHWVKAKDLKLFRISLSQEGFDNVVSDALAKGALRLCNVPTPDIDAEDLTDYVMKNKKSLLANIQDQITELVHVHTPEIYCDKVAFKNKRLYEPQQQCVKAVAEGLLRNLSKAYLLNEGMGVGKTIQTCGIVEQYFNSKYLKSHPDKTLKDCFKKGEVNYRNIVICPAHLTAKWKEEVEKEVPGATAIILNDFSQLVELREQGEARKGKQFYMIGKDFAKLGTFEKPSPYKCKKKSIVLPMCKDCYEEKADVYIKNKDGVCPCCGGTNFVAKESRTKAYGLVCPTCDNILMKPASVYNTYMDEEKMLNQVLRPADFAGQNSDNCNCFFCNSSNWQAAVKNIGGNKEEKWHKITHYANKAHKTKTTAWVLKGHESDYLFLHGLKEKVSLDNNGFEETAFNPPRRVAPAHYIKKYLKGYFDFAILDEVHKFESEGSAQTNAAHALVKASNMALGLTGTISNGTADCLFTLLWMLFPKAMVEKGWTKDDRFKFTSMYGTIGRKYEARKGFSNNSCSRGKQIASPKVKPGISPRLFVDFLMDKGVFLDITDLGRSLPTLTEKIELVPMPDDVAASYNHLLSDLKGALRSKEGAGALSNILQMGLSYPDKPFDRDPIKSTTVDNLIIAKPDNLENYKEDELLPKEERLCEIVRNEIAEDRNCFIYISYTGIGDANVIDRVGKIVEDNCNLRGRVCVIQSSTPGAKDREAYIKKKAAEGIRVFLINPKCCETGLDFCFDYDGRFYNYPTLIFYQISYELSVLWQASRRHYRANQTKECRTYWLAYERSLQATALQVMAEKQVAVSAIQGKFSSEGLSSMAKGINAQEKLMAALLEGDMSDATKLNSLFDKVNEANTYKDEDEEGFVFIQPSIYSEIMGEDDESTFSTSVLFDDVFKDVMSEELTEAPAFDFDTAFGNIFKSFETISLGGFDDSETKAKKKKKSSLSGQCDIFSLFA